MNSLKVKLQSSNKIKNKQARMEAQPHPLNQQQQLTTMATVKGFMAQQTDVDLGPNLAS
jgi:hypothetical protein